MIQKAWALLRGIGGVIAALIFLAAQVSHDAAASNLAGWLKWLGVAVPGFVETHAADNWAKGLAAAAMGALATSFLVHRARIRRPEATTEAEYLPIEEAGQWFYDNAPQWLQDHLRRPDPFPTISAMAQAFVGEAIDAGAGKLIARREPGLGHEPIKYADLKASVADTAFRAQRNLPTDALVRRADLPSILAYYRNPEQVIEKPLIVKRDTPLREALMFIVTREWGQDPMADGGDKMTALSAALTDFRQHAHDGTVTIWGRPNNHGVWQVIDPAYWIDHNVAFLDVLRSDTRTTATNQLSQAPLFVDLMVCRAEFEQAWQDAYHLSNPANNAAMVLPD